MNNFLDQYLSRGVRWILVANLLVFLCEVFAYMLDVMTQGQFGFNELFFHVFAQNPLFRYAETSNGMAFDFNWLALMQFFTYMFVHFDFWHLFWNMLGLWFFGPPLEARWGTPMFVKFYLFAGFMAGALHGLIVPLLPSVVGGRIMNYQMMGASGAVFAVLLAFAYYYPNQRILLWFLIPIPAKILVAILGIMAFYSLWFTSGSPVSNLTHVLGLGFGYLWIKGQEKYPHFWLFNDDPAPLYREEPPPRRFGGRFS